MSSKALIELTKNELKNTNYGRILLLEKFEQLIKLVNTEKKLKIGVIGGSKNEPEIIIFGQLPDLLYSAYLQFSVTKDEKQKNLG